MQTAWLRYAITLPAPGTRLYEWDGQWVVVPPTPAPAPGELPVQPIMFQWMQPDVAVAQARHAVAATRPEARGGNWHDLGFGALDAWPVAPGDYDLKFRQLQRVWEAFDAIAQFYNAINIPWSSDPVARALWRKWMAGQPVLAGSSTDPAEFSKDTEYNTNWYSQSTKDQIRAEGLAYKAWVYPIVRDAATAGLIPRRVYELLHASRNAGADQPIEFVPRAGVQFAINRAALRDTSSPDPTLAAEWINEAFAEQAWVRAGERICLSAPNDALFACHDAPYGPGSGCSLLGQACVGIYVPPWGNTIRSFDDWRMFYWRSPPASHRSHLVPVLAWGPLRDYMAWAAEWADAIAARTPEQVVVQARYFASNRNVSATRALGGVAAAMREWANVAGDVRAQATRPDPVVNSVAGGMAAVAAMAASTGGPYGAIAGAIIGLAAAITAIVNHIITHLPEKKRNDLGQWKPSFERITLGGDASVGSRASSGGGQPPFAVAAPPGYTPGSGGWRKPTTVRVATDGVADDAPGTDGTIGPLPIALPIALLAGVTRVPTGAGFVEVVDPAQAPGARAEAQTMLTWGGERPLAAACAEWRGWSPERRAARIAEHNAWSAAQPGGRTTWHPLALQAAAAALCDTGAPADAPKRGVLSAVAGGAAVVIGAVAGWLASGRRGGKRK
jgi:hypothetical protein